MELNPIGVFAILGGIVLLYAGVKNMYPQDVIRQAFGKEPLKGSIMTNATGRKLDNTSATIDIPNNTGLVIATV